MLQRSVIKDNISAVEPEGEVPKEAFTIQNSLDKAQGIERSNDNLGDSIHSSSRTKTACLSQNGFSEEVVKLGQYLSPLGDEPAHKLSEIEAIQPPNFEKSACVHSSELLQSQLSIFWRLMYNHFKLNKMNKN